MGFADGIKTIVVATDLREQSARSGWSSAAHAHPLAELLQCPPEPGVLLSQGTQSISADVGDVIFRQADRCRGLYIVVSGQFLRRAERLSRRLVLGVVRAGELVELAAVLGDGRHTCSLAAQTAGSLLLLSFESLQQAFEASPPLRMRLLEELAREVSRSYESSCQSRIPKTRRRADNSPRA